ncbi:AraC family transcriptional regulator [Pseudomonas aeruginosa]|nr:AraC family transcriptional regulator [Pseudomonas aeruginosa]
MRRIAEALLTNPGGSAAGGRMGTLVASAASLSRLFGAETGMSFCAMAATGATARGRRTAGSGQAVGEVASSPGYESPSSFASAFRTVFGETPSGYSSRANEALA